MAQFHDQQQIEDRVMHARVHRSSQLLVSKWYMMTHGAKGAAQPPRTLAHKYMGGVSRGTEYWKIGQTSEILPFERSTGIPGNYRLLTMVWFFQSTSSKH